MLHPEIIGHVQVILAMCIVGSSVAVGKVVSVEVPVFLASFIRFAVALLFIVPLNRMLAGSLRLPPRKVALLLGAQAFFGIFLFSVCLLLGLKRTAAVNAGVIFGMLPAVNALLSVWLLHEKLNQRYAIGIGLSVLGAVLLELRSADGGGFGVGVVGMLLILCAVFCEAMFSVIGKLSGLSLPAVTVTCWVILIGVALFMPGALYEAASFDFRSISPKLWWLLAYYGVVVTVIGFSLFYAGLSKISAVAAGVHMAFVPLSAMAIAVLILGEAFGLIDALSLSLLLVLAALFVIGLKPESPAQSLIEKPLAFLKEWQKWLNKNQ
ncbi:DMT family transporter [Verminephrobacter aporrectodeae]|uniref:DMT family transporter n=1 Tax=Verminephrobacter aporrectodeae TaxID=1110389 RepID=UPI0002377333|nr:DMT family transporter [Verminephrobacter aporrectodeae]